MVECIVLDCVGLILELEVCVGLMSSGFGVKVWIGILLGKFLDPDSLSLRFRSESLEPARLLIGIQKGHTLKATQHCEYLKRIRDELTKPLTACYHRRRR